MRFQRTHDFDATFEALTVGELAGDYFNALGGHRKELLRQHVGTKLKESQNICVWKLVTSLTADLCVQVYRYLGAFLLDSGIKIESCDRYSSETNGAKITSTRHWYVPHKLLCSPSAAPFTGLIERFLCGAPQVCWGTRGGLTGLHRRAEPG